MSRAYHGETGGSERGLGAPAWTAGEVVVPVRELAEVLEQGLLAMGVRAALVVAQRMMEAEREAITGPRGRHDPERKARRYGYEPGWVTLGGRKVHVRRPRARTLDGQEVRLETYELFQDATLLGELTLQRMLLGVASRKFGQAGEPVGPVEGYGTSKSAVSRRFVQATQEELDRVLHRPLGDLRLLVVFVDGIVFGGHTVLVALGVDAEGEKHVLGLWEGTTENAQVAGALLDDLVARGLDVSRGLLFVIDGARALQKAIRDRFGEQVLIQRCTEHKRRNVLEHLPEQERRWVEQRMRRAWALEDAVRAKAEMEALARELEVHHPGAASSLREGLEETLTVQRLHLPALLRQSLRTTNLAESLNSSLRRVTDGRLRRVTSGQQALRWAAVAALEAEKRFRRLRGHRDLPLLAQALEAHVQSLAEKGVETPDLARAS